MENLNIQDDTTVRILLAYAVVQNALTATDGKGFTDNSLRHYANTDIALHIRHKPGKSKGYWDWEAWCEWGEGEDEDAEGIEYDINSPKLIPVPIITWLAERLDVSSARGLDLTEGI